MTAEHEDIVRRLLYLRRIDRPEHPQITDNKAFIKEAGVFLSASGIMDAVLDFNEAFLGDMTAPRNESQPRGLIAEGVPTQAAYTSIVLEWIDPNDLRHLVFTVSAGRSNSGEKYLCATFKEIRHYKTKKHEREPPEFHITLKHLGRHFDFTSPITKEDKKVYADWLRKNILNYELIWREDIVQVQAVKPPRRSERV